MTKRLAGDSPRHLEEGPGYYFWGPERSEDELKINEWTPEAAAALATSGVGWVTVQHWDGPSIEPLVAAGGSVERLALRCRRKDVDLSALANLARIRELRIEGSPLEGIDFGVMACLRQLSLNLYPKRGLGTVADAPELQRLSIMSPQLRDLTPISSLSTLEALYLDEGALRSLDGLEHFVNLRALGLYDLSLPTLDGIAVAARLEELSLVGLRKVTSIAEVARLDELHKLTISRMKRLVDIHSIHSMTGLRVLALHGTGKLPSLAFLADLANLEMLELWDGTEIVDGDLSVLLRLPSLRKANILPKKHYSHSPAEVKAALDARLAS